MLYFRVLDAAGQQIDDDFTTTSAAMSDRRLRIFGVVFLVVLLVLAFVLASIVDPLLIDQAREQARTEGYEAPELKFNWLSDAVRNLTHIGGGRCGGCHLR